MSAENTNAQGQVTVQSIVQPVVRVGGALWPDPEQRDFIVTDVFSSMSLLGLSEGEFVERTVQHLLEKANSITSPGHRVRDLQQGDGTFRKFYGLDPRERLILVLLHSEHWDYAKIARLLGVTSNVIEATAWRLRIQMSSKYPLAPTMATPSCPEYDVHQPWIQRFLDDEYSKSSEKLFLQNHLMACSDCRRALQSCRDLYYRVDSMIPRYSENQKNVQALHSALISIFTRTLKERSKLLKKLRPQSGDQRKRIRPSLVFAFFLRPDVLFVTIVLVYMVRFIWKSQLH